MKGTQFRNFENSAAGCELARRRQMKNDTDFHQATRLEFKTLNVTELTACVMGSVRDRAGEEMIKCAKPQIGIAPKCVLFLAFRCIELIYRHGEGQVRLSHS